MNRLLILKKDRSDMLSPIGFPSGKYVEFVNYNVSTLANGNIKVVSDCRNNIIRYFDLYWFNRILYNV